MPSVALQDAPTTAASHRLWLLDEIRKYHGKLAACQWIVARTAQKLLCLEVSQLLWLESCRLVNPEYTEHDFEFRFLTPEEVRTFAADPANELASEFADRTAAGDDLCFAALEFGQRLAAYSWYARGSIEGAHHVGVPMSFPPDVAYMYNAFTHPEFRGHQLFGRGVIQALEQLAARGIVKLITSVNATNFASLRSCQRQGWAPLGQLWTLGNGPSRRAWVPRKAKQLDIRFGAAATICPRSQTLL